MTESKLTKFSALFLALLTLLGTVFSVPVTAATGDKAVITFTYCYDSNGNTIKFHPTKQPFMMVIRSDMTVWKSLLHTQTEKKPTAFSLDTRFIRAIF